MNYADDRISMGNDGSALTNVVYSRNLKISQKQVFVNYLIVKIWKILNKI